MSEKSIKSDDDGAAKAPQVDHHPEDPFLCTQTYKDDAGRDYMHAVLKPRYYFTWSGGTQTAEQLIAHFRDRGAASQSWLQRWENYMIHRPERRSVLLLRRVGYDENTQV